MESLVQRLLSFLLHGGTAQLQSFERQILERIASSLPEPDKATLLQQLERVGRVQRYQKGRQINVFVAKKGVPALTNTGEATVLGRLQLRAEETDVTVAVIAHRGYISSIEFNKPPGPLARAPFVVVSAQPMAPHVSPASAADRLEHGRR